MDNGRTTMASANPLSGPALRSSPKSVTMSTKNVQGMVRSPSSESPRKQLRRSLTSPPSPAAAMLQQLNASSPTSRLSGRLDDGSRASISSNTTSSNTPINVANPSLKPTLQPSPFGLSKHDSTKGTGETLPSNLEKPTEQIKQQPMSAVAVESAMVRLASQYHLSDYNMMKRNMSQPVPIPAQSQTMNVIPGISALPRVRQAIKTVESVQQNGQDASHAEAAKTLLSLKSQSPVLQLNPVNSVPRPTANGPPAAIAQSVIAPPPPAPHLYRSYTEEEGQNPDVSPNTSLQSALNDASSISLTTPTPSLSMSTSNSDPGSISLNSDEDVRMRGSSPGPATPPDDGPLSSYTVPSEIKAPKGLKNPISLSPTIKKSEADVILDRDLSRKLEDAMVTSLREPPLASPQTSRARSVSPAMPTSRTQQPPTAHITPKPAVTKALSAPQPQVSPHFVGARPVPSFINQDPAAYLDQRSGFSVPVSRSHSQPLPSRHAMHPGLVGVKTSITHPMNVSPIIPPELLSLYGQLLLKPTNIASTSAGPSQQTLLSQIGNNGVFVLPPYADIHLLTGPDASSALFHLTLPISQSLAMSSATPSEPSLESTTSVSPRPLQLGNLVLSSCPGKKVRLSDQHLNILGIPEVCRPGKENPPVDPRSLPGAAVVATTQVTRSPICRDIKLDFLRAIQEADVKVVVCCIDDVELKFLGAAWEEYSRVAAEVGLEVIRLPMDEGFAPATPDELDAHLSYLIRNFTLQGKTALVHCRGGVGRAGLFACSWMIKLGLLGKVSGIHDPDQSMLDEEMKLVVKVIEVIRKRRSAKAIETPQQVHFILQYINWLSRNAHEFSATSVLAQSDRHYAA